MSPFYTIGHSTRSIEEFVALLQTAAVTLVVEFAPLQSRPLSLNTMKMYRSKCACGLSSKNLEE